MYERPVDLRWWRHRDGQGVVFVEDESDRDASLDRGLKRVEERVAGRILQPQVIDGDIQRSGRAIQEGGEALGDGVGDLAAVGQKI